jgi:hypothetical protein
MNLRRVTFALALLASSPLAARAQVGYLWSIDELRTCADLVVVAEWVATEDVGRGVDQPEQESSVPAIESRTTLKVLAILKNDGASLPAAVGGVLLLTHYRIDDERWQRANPGRGLVNTGTVLQFRNQVGPYLLFLKKSHKGGYEPLSGHTFPTDSVFLLSKAGRPPG